MDAPSIRLQPPVMDALYEALIYYSIICLAVKL